jgi:lipopolysaccharide/colanic/teichoic acid biosynthesis glycosyltransferase
MVKPVIDLLGGLTLVILAAPVMAAVAVTVGLKIGRPIIFSQERIGLDGEPFRLYKFRTMIPDRRQGDCAFSGDNRRSVHKSPFDPRVVSVGARLRALRLDELPQIWNILNGDMSLVGPRPEMTDIVERYADWQHLRHVVKPGLTGLWQVSEHNDRLMFECTDMDLDYVASIGPITDVTILMRTPFAMARRGGY